ncbi:MAG: cation:proton antiporter [Smithellaceae bacterium]|jgi:CPA2 family monovalent cation:H+ antiporter-2
MEGILFFKKLLIILGFSIPVIYLFNKVKLPSIIGFLITGVVIGPFGLKLIDDTAGIQFMAEIGVAFLLFTIGIEIQFSRFLKNLSEIFLSGGLQILCTFIVGMLIGLAMQLSLNQSIFVGFILTHSSSALILKLLKDRSDEDSPQGKISIGVILSQDLMVVPMMLMIPFLAGGSGPDALMIVWKMFKSILIIVVILAAARYVIPFMLERLVSMNMRDVLVITSVVVAMGIAWITESLGLSLAIGAFLAGMALSDTDFTHQIISDINPFRDVFLSVFFVSLGMILDINFLREHTGYILLVSLCIILIKAAIVFGLVKLLRYPLRVCLLSGVMLAQIGEFSFVLASQGLHQNIISGFVYQGFIGASVLTFIATPLLVSLTYYLLAKKRIAEGIPLTEKSRQIQLSNHAIICGLGLNGKNLIKVLKNTGINYVIIDLNFKNIKEAKAKGEKNIIWGDASNAEILKHAGIDSARVLVIAISDRFLTKRCLDIAKSIKPDLHVIVRTKYVADIDELVKLGADNIIPEEYETSIQILSRVLRMYHVPNSIILAQGNIIRNKSYGVFREVRFTEEAFEQINQILAQGTIETFYVASGSTIIGQSIKDLDLRARTDATILNIIRDNKTITNPSSDFVFQAADQLIIFGSHSALDMALAMLGGREAE